MTSVTPRVFLNSLRRDVASNEAADFAMQNSLCSSPSFPENGAVDGGLFGAVGNVPPLSLGASEATLILFDIRWNRPDHPN